MIPLPIISLIQPLQVNDWYLLFLTVSFLASLSLMGPFAGFYFQGLSVMFRFNSPESDLSFPMYSPVGYVVVSVVSCFNLGLALSLSQWDLSGQGAGMIWKVLSASGVFGASCAIKLLLYQVVNSSMYKAQITTIKPIRWNGFFVMAFSAASFIVLVFAAVVLFMGLPEFILTIGSFLVLLTIEIGLIFRLKTSLFKKKYSVSGFFLYLCALEFGPIILMLVLLSKTLS